MDDHGTMRLDRHEMAVCKRYRHVAALGAAELGGLIEDYRGSYIMTFAASASRNGSSVTAIRAIPKSTPSTGSN